MLIVECHNDSYLWLCDAHKLYCTLLYLHIHHTCTPNTCLITQCTNVAHAQVLLTWFTDYGWLIFLSAYKCALISLTNLDLTKLMFVSCGFALGSLLCVCSFADFSTLLSRKRAYNWCSIIPCFKIDSMFISSFKQWEIQNSSWFTNLLKHLWRCSYYCGVSGQIWYLENNIYP